MKKTAFLYMALCLLAACGIKPGEVSAPETGHKDRFPHTYPDLKTDPAPHIPPSP
jgi:hypothetical protein